ncbi:MAG: non-canonical purine NTP pyrophosphatase [Phycisphaerales bacterium]|nr:non-canonical purine NTP pyrophosphatase [Planctomycetota bacterium]
MISIVLATGNPHKVDEMRAIFAELAPAVSLLGLRDLQGPTPAEPAETGTTFEQNAAIKATAYARATGRMCLADDSGLEIDALRGRPGVISSHYCSDGREVGMTREQRDLANNQRVLAELAGFEDPARTARFVCVMALSAPDGHIRFTSRGTFEGLIGRQGQVPRGNNGFGYDPLFLVAPDFASTSAELDTAAKNRLSHRRRAAVSMAEFLRSL